GALLADEVVWHRVQPAAGRDVEDVSGLPAVVEEPAQRVGHVAVGCAEHLLVLLERPDPRRLVARPLLGRAEEGGDAGLDALERQVAIAGGLDVDAGRLVNAAHGITLQTRSALAGALGGVVDALVDLGDLLDPHVALLVLHLQDVVHAPVKMVRDVGYLAGDLVQRVAYDSPSAVAPVPMSTWNSCPQLGHF